MQHIQDIGWQWCQWFLYRHAGRLNCGWFARSGQHYYKKRSGIVRVSCAHKCDWMLQVASCDWRWQMKKLSKIEKCSMKFQRRVKGSGTQSFVRKQKKNRLDHTVVPVIGARVCFFRVRLTTMCVCWSLCVLHISHLLLPFALYSSLSSICQHIHSVKEELLNSAYIFFSFVHEQKEKPSASG